MSLANYNDLLASLASWSHKEGSTALTAVLPDFVRLAEARMSADLSVKALEKNQNATITAGVATLPDDVLEVLGLRIVGATRPEVEVTSRERIQELTDSSYSGLITYGALIGRTVELYPTTSGTLQVRAKCRVPPLVDNQTNWVLTTFPNVYLYGSLVELAEHVKDHQAKASWFDRYREAVTQCDAAITYRGQMAKSKVWGVR